MPDVSQYTYSGENLKSPTRILWHVGGSSVLPTGRDGVATAQSSRRNRARPNGGASAVGEAVIIRHAGAIRPGTPGKRISAHADTVEFHGLVAVLNSMLDRLDHALASQRRIIADVAHELRTPITAMQGELEIALRGERTPEEYRQVLVPTGGGGGSRAHPIRSWTRQSPRDGPRKNPSLKIRSQSFQRGFKAPKLSSLLRIVNHSLAMRGHDTEHLKWRHTRCINAFLAWLAPH